MKTGRWTGHLAYLRPNRIVGGRMRYVVALMSAAGIAAIALELQPQPLSATWWLLAAVVALGALAAVIHWERVSPIWQLIEILAIDALGIGVLWLNPADPAVGLFFAFTTVFTCSRYPVPVVGVHLAAVAAALVGFVAVGGTLGQALILGMSMAAIAGFGLALNLALQRENMSKRSLQSLLDLIPVLKAHGVKEVIEAAVSQLVKVTVSDSGIVFLMDQERQVLHVGYMHFTAPLPPDEEEAWASVELPVGQGLTGWAVANKQSIITGDAANDPRAHQLAGTPVVDESILIVPLITQSRVHGVLRLTRDGLDQYEHPDLELLEVMAAHVADALSRAALEEQMSRTDGLTGVYNRHFLNEWSQSLRREAIPISLLMIDCRDFKQINDIFGHLAGDRILQEVSRLLRAHTRSGDLVVRYGGDEFLVVFPRMTGEQAIRIADRIRSQSESWNEEQAAGGPQMRLDIGVESDMESSWDDLLARADAQMYSSKRSAD